MPKNVRGKNSKHCGARETCWLAWLAALIADVGWSCWLAINSLSRSCDLNSRRAEPFWVERRVCIPISSDIPQMKNKNPHSNHLLCPTIRGVSVHTHTHIYILLTKSRTNWMSKTEVLKVQTLLWIKEKETYKQTNTNKWINIPMCIHTYSQGIIHTYVYVQFKLHIGAIIRKMYTN